MGTSSWGILGSPSAIFCSFSAKIPVFVLASLLTIVAFEVIVNAVERFGQPVEQSILGLVILIFFTDYQYLFDVLGASLG